MADLSGDRASLIMALAERASFDLLTRYERSPWRLREALALDPVLRAEAEAELAALAGVNDGRCIMTREYRRALQEALG